MTCTVLKDRPLAVFRSELLQPIGMTGKHTGNHSGESVSGSLSSNTGAHSGISSGHMCKHTDWRVNTGNMTGDTSLTRNTAPTGSVTSGTRSEGGSCSSGLVNTGNVGYHTSLAGFRSSGKDLLETSVRDGRTGQTGETGECKSRNTVSGILARNDDTGNQNGGSMSDNDIEAGTGCPCIKGFITPKGQTNITSIETSNRTVVVPDVTGSLAGSAPATCGNSIHPGTCAGHRLVTSTNSNHCLSHPLVTSSTGRQSGGRASRGSVKSLVLLLLLHMLAAPVAGRDLTPQDITDIERFTEHVRQCHGVTAISLSVVQRDKAVMKRGFGHSDVAQGTKATADTPFCIGSVTKAFTSTLLALQIAESKNGVDWDTPLHCFPHSDISFSDDIRSSQTSLRDLLSHRLGVPGYFGVLQVGYPVNTTRKEVVQRFRFMQPTHPFRSGILYNNFLYGMAGYGAELLADRAATWEELTQAAIFNPAGMTSSGFIDRTPEPPGLALPYVYVNGSLYPVDTSITKPVGPLGPAGSIYSTAADMARWMQLHLAVLSHKEVAGSTRQTVVPFPGTLSLGSAAVNQVWETYQAQMPEPPFGQSLTRPMFPVDDVELSYAMGWVRGIYRGYRKLFHTGGISTYISLVQLLPDMDSGIFLSTSGPSGRAGGIVNRLVASYITDKITGLPHWFNDSTACTFPAPWAVAIMEDYKEAGEAGEGGGMQGGEKKPLATLAPPLLTDSEYTLNPLNAFPGEYSHYAFGTVRVYVQGGRLYSRYGRFGHFQLEPTSVVGFYLGNFLDKLWYVSNQDGQRSTFDFQFTDIDNGQAQHLVLPIDPSQAATFRRGLDADSLPPPTRRYPGLYSCPATLSSSADRLSLHSMSRVGATILATLGAFTINKW